MQNHLLCSADLFFSPHLTLPFLFIPFPSLSIPSLLFPPDPSHYFSFHSIPCPLCFFPVHSFRFPSFLFFFPSDSLSVTFYIPFLYLPFTSFTFHSFPSHSSPPRHFLSIPVPIPYFSFPSLSFLSPPFHFLHNLYFPFLSLFLNTLYFPLNFSLFSFPSPSDSPSLSFPSLPALLIPISFLSIISFPFSTLSFLFFSFPPLPILFFCFLFLFLSFPLFCPSPYLSCPTLHFVPFPPFLPTSAGNFTQRPVFNITYERRQLGESGRIADEENIANLDMCSFNGYPVLTPVANGWVPFVEFPVVSKHSFSLPSCLNRSQYVLVSLAFP